MKIMLKNIIPNVILDYQNSQVWNKQICFEPCKNYLIKASSGKGKTTFTKILSGQSFNYLGMCSWNNLPISQIKPKNLQLYYKDVFTFVWQDLKLFNNLTAYQNINLVKEVTKTSTDEQIINMAKTLNVQNCLNKKINTLSFGQKQRVAIIRALSKKFKWIILDEPFSHLDKKNQQLAANLIASVSQKNNAGIIITSLGENNEINYYKTFSL